MNRKIFGIVIIFVFAITVAVNAKSPKKRRAAEIEAAKLIKNPSAKVYCEDGDGEPYNTVELFIEDASTPTNFAIIAYRLLDEDASGPVLVLAEQVKRDKKTIKRKTVQDVNGFHYFEQEKYVSNSLTLTLYRMQENLEGGISCGIKSKVKELNRGIGAMDGRLPRSQ